MSDSQSTNTELQEEKINDGEKEHHPKATRKSLQWGRRIFHLTMGAGLGTIYLLFLERNAVVSLLGAAASSLYLLEQIRINYPELSEKISLINKFFLRAEERLRESSAIPYSMGLLLTILTFPKLAALIAIFSLALGDPLSAIVGISWGKHKIAHHKSLEGSLTFMLCVFTCSFLLIHYFNQHLYMENFQASLCISLIAALLEMIPLRVDDNLTIPLFTASISWPILYLFGLTLS